MSWTPEKGFIYIYIYETFSSVRLLVTEFDCP